MVPQAQEIQILLYDVLGQRVKTIVNGERKGCHKQQVDVSRLADGVYFLRLTAESATKSQRLTIVR